MADWTALADALFEIGKPIRSVDITALKNNVTALAEGASGAPRLQTAAYNDLSVTTGKLANSAATQAKVAAAAIGQAQLKTATGGGSVSTGWTRAVLPGGEYGFVPGFYNSIYPSFNVFPEALVGFFDAGSGTPSFNHNTQTSYVSTRSYGGSGTFLWHQRYIQASPPYDLGDGEVPLFVFALVDSNGEVQGTWIAPDPPWANNGPTDCRALYYDKQGRGWKYARDYSAARAIADPIERAEAMNDAPWRLMEVTHEIKNADMSVLPHPWATIPDGTTPVLLDPVSPLVQRLALLHWSGEDVDKVLREHVRFGAALSRRVHPPNVDAVEARLKDSRQLQPLQHPIRAEPPPPPAEAGEQTAPRATAAEDPAATTWAG